MKKRFNFNTKIQVRFSDTDAMGHVNNANYFTYMEEGRVAFVNHLFPEYQWKDDLKDFPFIVASIECSFKSPLYASETVVVFLGVTKIGNKSFTIEYELFEEKSERLVGTGSSVLVMYDYHKQETCSIPEELRKRLTSFQP